MDTESLLEEIKQVPKTKVKWTCPICGGMYLQKQKEIFIDFENMLENKVNIIKGELYSEVYDSSGNLVHKSKFPIRYCPWCGKKVKRHYKRTGGKHD